MYNGCFTLMPIGPLLLGGNLTIPFDPRFDRTLNELKMEARTGSDRGKFFDQGVLSVITGIELKGGFVPDRFASLVLLHPPAIPYTTLSSSEAAEIDEGMACRGWTPEHKLDLVQHSEGVQLAEAVLSKYRLVDEQI